MVSTNRFDLPLEPATRAAIAEIAHRLRDLHCENTIIAMQLHEIARCLEAIAETGRPLSDVARCLDQA